MTGKRALIWGVGVLVVIVALTAVTLTVWSRRGFPTTSGELVVPGMDEPVEVLRDDHGVPTIVASSTDDLFRAQGYVHAQDRFWEMDMRRHVTAGRTAELFGESQIDTDRFVRTLGWRRIAEAELDLLAPETTAMLEAYAEGVNAWLDGRRGSQLSLEHALLRLTGAGGYVPEPWTPADSVAWLKAMAWDLRSNLEDELLRGRLSGVELANDRAWQDLYPGFPADRHPPILPDGGTTSGDGFEPAAGDLAVLTTNQQAAVASHTPSASRDALAAADDALAAAHDALAASPQVVADGAADGVGSNSWVIAPQRSASGGALLANDPHLAPSQPSVWYQVGLRCEPVGPDCPLHVVGFSFSGLPGIIIGHNERVAWGFTNLGADVADLIVERIDGDRYLTADGWQELDQRTESIRVAGDDDVEVTIRHTVNGPLLSDVSEAAEHIALNREGGDADTPDPEHSVALRWVALDPHPTLDAMPAFMRASNWADLRDAASKFSVPSQSIVYADVDGHIGYQAPGRIPVRLTGDGTLPLPGWTGEFGWERFLDFEELPWSLDPPGGYLATANQPVLPDGQVPFLTADANVGYRAARIVELLEGRDGLTPTDLLALQVDDHNGNAANLVPTLVAVDAGASEAVSALQAVLADWDGRDAADSSGAAAFNATWRRLLADTFHDELPEWAWPTGSARWWEVVRRLVEEPRSPWWDDVTTSRVETRDDILVDAMAGAHRELAERFGDDPGRWTWGAMHTLTLEHQTFGTSGIGPVERLFNRGPLQAAGGSDVVNATGWVAHEGYEVTWVPSMRMVIDLADLDAGRWIQLTGQSGRPFHPHYTDQAEAWRDGDTIPIAFSAAAVEAAAVERLKLVPPDAPS